MINQIFSNALAAWVRYDGYEMRESGWSDTYFIPSPDAKPIIYNPIDLARDMSIEAMNVGRVMDSCEYEFMDISKQLLQFVRKYGFLGVMVDVPMNDNFYEAEETHFIPNPFFPIDEKMDTQEYMAKFFPFEETVPQLEQTDTSISAYAGRKPIYEYIFSSAYSEWLMFYVSYFQNLYKLFSACMTYVDEPQVFRAMALRSGILQYSDHKLRYSIAAAGQPVMRWEFASLKAVMDLFVVGCITDPAQPIRQCKHCGKIFYRDDLRMEFCSPQCRNRFNVYKSRAKKVD